MIELEKDSNTLNLEPLPKKEVQVKGKFQNVSKKI